jgi:F-type H+-transporting ATPase subunit b
VHTVSVFLDGAGDVSVLLHSNGHPLVGPLVAQAEETEPDEGPSPISPEPKELLWSLGAFLVLLIAMRLYLVPKVKQGMQARYAKNRSELESAEAIRDAAKAEVAEYQAQLAAVRAEAAARVDAARDQLDRERADRMAEANAAIAERRSSVATEAEAARLAARSSVEDAVAAAIVERSTGVRPDEGRVRRAVTELTTTGAPS